MRALEAHVAQGLRHRTDLADVVQVWADWRLMAGRRADVLGVRAQTLSNELRGDEADDHLHQFCLHGGATVLAHTLTVAAPLVCTVASTVWAR
jgi:hypothetical protein